MRILKAFSGFFGGILAGLVVVILLPGILVAACWESNRWPWAEMKSWKNSA